MSEMYYLEEYELECLLKGMGYDELTVEVVSEYLDQCSCEYDLSRWIPNVLDCYVHCFNSKDDMISYMDDEGLSIDDEDLRIYETYYGKFYLETY